MNVDSNPLSGVVVVNAGRGFTVGLIARFLGDLGAEVIRAREIDNDPLSDQFPVLARWNAVAPVTDRDLDDLAGNVDVIIFGGEDYPGLERIERSDELSARNPRLITLDLSAMPRAVSGSNVAAHELILQARSGFSWEHYTDRPAMFAYHPASRGAALQGVSAILGALISRERSGRGQVAATSLYEGALMWLASLWYGAENHSRSSSMTVPKNPGPMILQCADGQYIHIFLGAPAAVPALYEELGLGSPGKEAMGLWASPDPKKFFGNSDEITEAVAKRDRMELVAALTARGVTAGPVLPPGECWSDPQIDHQDLIRTWPDGSRSVGAIVRSHISPAQRRLPSVPEDASPLDGVTILDLGTYVAGPYGGVVLADLGADVIKVEAMGGDMARAMHRVYAAANRGKRAIKIDFKHPAAAQIIERLAERADGVMSNFRNGVSARRGVDAATLHAGKPQAVVLECPAYGMDGPRAKEPGFDPVMQAWAGHEARQGGPGSVPVWNRMTMVDYCGGALGGIAMLAGLYRRASSGAGSAVSSSLLGSALFLMSELVKTESGEFIGAPAIDPGHSGLHPAESLYQTSDGWIALVALGDAAATVARALGLTEAADRPRAEWDELERAALQSAIAQLDATSAIDIVSRAGGWAEYCRTDCESGTLNDPELVERGIVQKGQHAQLGATTEIGPLFQFSKSGVAAGRRAPAPGEHSREILSECGFTGEEIDALFAAGAVI